MKKFFASLLAALLMLAPLAGCGKSDSTPNYVSAKDGEWVEVQSITYYLNTASYTLISKYSWNTADKERVEEEEYRNSIQNQENISLSGEIDINKECLIKNPKQYIGKNYYFIEEDSYPSLVCYKKKLTDYNIYYVKIRFLRNDDIEINYCDYNANSYHNKDTNQTIRVKPLVYKIAYFND